jgi:type III secretion protein R
VVRRCGPSERHLVVIAELIVEVIALADGNGALLAFAGLIVAVGLLPIAVVMLTSYTKIVVVLSLLKNALGLQQVPPPVVTNGLALAAHFGDVTVTGMSGNERVEAEFARRRRTGRRILALDVFDLRHRLPDRALAVLHSAGRRVLYPILNRGDAEVTTADDFHLMGADETITDDVLVLAGVARA